LVDLAGLDADVEQLAFHDGISFCSFENLVLLNYFFYSRIGWASKVASKQAQKWLNFKLVDELAKSRRRFIRKQ